MLEHFNIAFKVNIMLKISLWSFLDSFNIYLKIIEIIVVILLLRTFCFSLKLY